MDEVELRKLIAQAEGGELSVALKREELHRSEDVGAIMSDMHDICRSHLISLPTKLVCGQTQSHVGTIWELFKICLPNSGRLCRWRSKIRSAMCANKFSFG